MYSNFVNNPSHGWVLICLPHSGCSELLQPQLLSIFYDWQSGSRVFCSLPVLYDFVSCKEACIWYVFQNQFDIWLISFHPRAIKHSKKNNGRGLLDFIQKLSSSTVVMLLIMVTELQLTWRLEGSWVEMAFWFFHELKFYLYIRSLSVTSKLKQIVAKRLISIRRLSVCLSQLLSHFLKLVFGGCI